MSTYACADLHGCYDLYKSINDFIQPEDQVIFLGDACDRGPQSWETVCAILDNPQWIYLMGNHEQMLLEPLDFWLKRHKIHHNFLSFKNGGLETFNQAIRDPNLRERYAQLSSLTISKSYQNTDGFIVFCSHAGFTPWLNHNGYGIVPVSIDNLLWDRSHIYEDWKEEEMNGAVISVHGHTPIPYMTYSLRMDSPNSEALWYCNDHKICLDTSCWATHYTILLNLDTFEEHIFKEA